MKKIILPLLLFFNQQLFSQNVGIGTTNPLARLHVTDSAVLFSTNGLPNFINPAVPPLEGEGRRFMWYPEKAALRAGYVQGLQWNKDSIGFYSTAYGVNSIAKGTLSFAMGEDANATGNYSFAFGFQPNANGNNSVAIGNFNNSIGLGSVTIGTSNTATGSSAIALGNYLSAKANGAIALGTLNDDTDNPLPVAGSTDRVFQVGIGGPMIAIKKNAMTILRNGDIGIGTLVPKARLHVADSNVLFGGPGYLSGNPGPPPVNGTGIRMMWYPAKAAFRAGQVIDNNWSKENIGEFSFAAGYNPIATGIGSVAIGMDVAATESGSTAIGLRTVASGSASTALGIETKATGYQSTALGYQTEARGHTSLSMGSYNIAKSNWSTVLGLYNDTSATESLFEIGNGNFNNRRNAVTVLFNGNVGIGTTLPAAKLHVDNSVVFTGAASLPASPANTPITGAGTRTMWYADKAAFRAGYVTANQWDKDNIGNYSFAAGRNSIASAPESVSIGGGNTATGNNSFSAGNNSQAMGIADIAIGSYAIANGFIAYSLGYNTLSNGTMSYAFGQNTVASAWTSTSMGAFTKAKSNYSLVIGQFNDTTATNRLFEIGNGTTDNDRRNAFTVLNNGYVGIGHKAPTRPLSFPATLGEKILLYPGGNGEVGIGVYGNELRLHADNPGAKVSFGTQTNAGVFTEAGKFEISNGYALTVFGNIWANGITYNSDARFKKNIVPLKDPLKKLQQINGVQYEMMANEFPEKNFIKGTQVGLLAQEVEAVMPEVVSTNADGYKSVDYAKLVPLLIESIKELKHQMGTMQDEINTLKNKQATSAK